MKFSTYFWHFLQSILFASRFCTVNCTVVKRLTDKPNHLEMYSLEKWLLEFALLLSIHIHHGTHINAINE